VFFGNDFSHAVANGIEATFSRNQFLRNRIDECWHGVWAGYSYDTVFRDNTFANNEEGIAIEHGQNITIADNTFMGDHTGIRLWANASQDPNWGYPKNHDTRSRDYVIQQNTFSGQQTAIALTRTANVQVQGNAYLSTAVPLQVGAEVTGLQFEPSSARSPLPAYPEIPRRPGAADAMLPRNAPRGRQTIVVDDWGPYDFRSPKVWPTGKLSDRPLKFRVMGPVGKWELKSIRGGSASAQTGVVPAELTVTPSGTGLDLTMTFEYVGAPVVTPRGQPYAAGTAVPFTYRAIDPAVNWTVKWWSYDVTSDPVTAPDAFEKRLRADPVVTDTRSHLGFLSSGSLAPGLPVDHVAMRAEAAVPIPAGGLDLQVLSNDGVRVWVDGALVIDRWTVHDTRADHAPLAAGTRRIRIDYFDATSWAELQVSFLRRNP
jgi:parallel beta-helix repeat protein